MRNPSVLLCMQFNRERLRRRAKGFRAITIGNRIQNVCVSMNDGRLCRKRMTKRLGRQTSFLPAVNRTRYPNLYYLPSPGELVCLRVLVTDIEVRWINSDGYRTPFGVRKLFPFGRQVFSRSRIAFNCSGGGGGGSKTILLQYDMQTIQKRLSLCIDIIPTHIYYNN